jgi:RNA polymerase sigma factor (TIGR02999 family)
VANISSSSDDINYLLSAWSDGDKGIENQLIELLYPDIHKIAHFQIKSNSSNSLQTTEIVNEAFIKLSAQRTVNWQNKNHFLAIAAKVIRRVVVDYYRAQYSQKRGGAEIHLTLEGADEFIEQAVSGQLNWLELDDLLNALHEIDSQAAQVTELKVFGGMTIPEMAKTMAVSEPTISRNWKFAKTWLLCHFNE